MEKRGLVFLLLSGCVLVCQLQTDGFVRRFHAVSLQSSWADAQSYCRENFMDLAIIQNPADNSDVLQVMDGGQYWIGLFYSYNWRWSQDNQRQTGFYNWASGEPRAIVRCASISKAGIWTSRDCGSTFSTLCYSAASKKHILVQTPMNRTAAQTYCRSRYTDLSSIRSLQDNLEVIALLEVSSDGGVDAWFGLFRFFWLWSDLSSLSFTQWANNQPAGKSCALMDSSSSEWDGKDCNEQHPFICEEAVTLSAVTSVKVRLRGRPAVLNDPVLQDHVLQQLKQKLQEGGITGDVTLRWRTQPDGKVFLREKDRAPPADREDAAACDLI